MEGLTNSLEDEAIAKIKDIKILKKYSIHRKNSTKGASVSIRSVQILNVLRNMHILPDWRGYFVYDIIELHMSRTEENFRACIASMI